MPDGDSPAIASKPLRYPVRDGEPLSLADALKDKPPDSSPSNPVTDDMDDDTPDIPTRDFYDYRLFKRPYDPRWRQVCGVMAMKRALLKKYMDREPEDTSLDSSLFRAIEPLSKTIRVCGYFMRFCVLDTPAFFLRYAESFWHIKRDTNTGRYVLR